MGLCLVAYRVGVIKFLIEDYTMLATVKLNGIVVCWINKRRSYSGINSYEIGFPQEDTLKSLYLGDISEVHKWLDRKYEGWVIV